MIEGFFADVWNGMVITFWIVVSIFVIAIGIAFVSAWSKSDEAQREKARIRDQLEPAKAKVAEIVTAHLDTLVSRRAAMVRRDAYGVVEAAGWQKEVQHFMDKVIVPQLSPIELAAIHDEGINKVFQELVEDRVAAHQELLKDQIGSIEGLTPFEFEQWCETQLNKSGWRAERTKNGADQGADIIAEKDGLRVAVQCKLYARPVGNGAVQEAFASKQFYRTNLAAVISNSGFTPSARQLATTTGVVLLSHTEIGLLEKRLEQA